MKIKSLITVNNKFYGNSSSASSAASATNIALFHSLLHTRQTPLRNLRTQNKRTDKVIADDEIIIPYIFSSFLK